MLQKQKHPQVSFPNEVLPSVELLQRFYHQMLLIRRFEEKTGQLYGMGLIGGFCHLYIGQEAVVVGMQSVTQVQDSIITSYRDHGHMLACGMEPNGVMAELLGRASGYSKGKGGSMHMFSREKNFFGGHGIVGAQVSLGTGLAFAHKYKKDKGICFVYYGDGAANQGQVYESFNMASLWSLPAIYIIENNQYSMGTALSRGCSGKGLYKRAEPFGIPGETVDGMDVLAVRHAGLKAVEYVRSGKGPYVLQMETYRFRGHSMSDPGKYRPKEELETMKASQDPLFRFKNLLITSNTLKEEEFKEIEKEVKNTVTAAAEFAQNSPLPEETELWTDVLI